MVIGTTQTMTYMAGGDAEKMGFEWDVVEGAQDDDGVSVPAADVVLNSGTITDLVGNPIVELAHPALADQAGHPVDGIRPVASAVRLIGAPSAWYIFGDNIDIGVDFTEDVKHNPAASESLGVRIVIGSSTSTAEQSGGATASTTLVFEHTVSASDSGSLSVPAGEFVLASGASVMDDSANDLDPPEHPALPSLFQRQVDGIVPTIEGMEIVSDPGTDGYYIKDDHIEVKVSFSENVSVDPTTTLALEIGSTIRDMRPQGAPDNSSTTPFQIFRYTVGAGEMDSDGISIPQYRSGTTPALSTGITDIGGNPLTRTHSGISDASSHKVDSIIPTVSSVTIVSDPDADGYDDVYKIGDVIEVEVLFSENVTVTGTPSLP